MNPRILLLLAMLAGWMNRNQQRVIEYLQEENRVLRPTLKGRAISALEPSAFCISRRTRGVVVASEWSFTGMSGSGGLGVDFALDTPLDYLEYLYAPRHPRKRDTIPTEQLKSDDI